MQSRKTHVVVRRVMRPAAANAWLAARGRCFYIAQKCKQEKKWKGTYLYCKAIMSNV